MGFLAVFLALAIASAAPQVVGADVQDAVLQLDRLDVVRTVIMKRRIADLKPPRK
jgi:hypothetical protein